MSYLHHDQARRAAEERLAQTLTKSSDWERLVLIDDLYGRLRLVAWPGAGSRDAKGEQLGRTLGEECGRWWSGQIWVVGGAPNPSDEAIYVSTWEEARPSERDRRLRIMDRVRAKASWTASLMAPPWPRQPGMADGPPILVFYSFKGGVGRTTALASFAVLRARAGERVVVLDGDLDAPGVGALLTPTASPVLWGVADYLLEGPAPEEASLADYYHVLREDSFTGGVGEIYVLPAGRLDGQYLAKVAKLDFEPPPPGQPHPWSHLVERVRKELAPHWILIDSRAGLGDPAGLLLGGFAHLQILFGTHSDQSWQGIGLVLDRLGKERLCRDQPQLDCVLVQAMVPENVDTARSQREAFSLRARDEFEDRYYAGEDQQDSFWSLADAESRDAPHQPVSISYKQPLAAFSRLADVTDILTGPEYEALSQRICSHFLEDVE
ncbi:MAG: hypothetical protein FJ387_08070 [Verrucomicrobia bacterium]|nr:hypothetical protein [Verrucomicrobiota bacterium]